MQVELIGDEHRDRVWKDRNGDYWQWYQDDERRGWKYQSPHNRWRFGGMHIPNCGPFTFVSESQETNMQVDELIREWRNKAEVIRRFSPEYKRGEADVWDYCADQLVAVSGTNKAETWHVPADDGSGMVEIRPVTVTPPIGPPPNQGRAMKPDTPWTYARRMLIVSVAWVGSMSALFCGGSWPCTSQYPPWN